eukprot:3940583-Rhodomonas_salina.5
MSSVHPGHYHCALITKVPPSIILGTSILPSSCTSKRLDIQKLTDNLSEWQTAVSSALAETATTDAQKAHQAGKLPDGIFRQEELLTALSLAHDEAYKLAGQETKAKKGIPFSNKTTLAMLRNSKTIQRALKTLQHPAAHGNTGLLLQARALCSEMDHSTPPAHEWSLLDRGTLTELLTAADQLWYKAHNKLIHQMHSSQIHQFLTLCLDRYEKGGSGEIQRFLQRTSPRDHIPRDCLRLYQSILVLPPRAEEAWLNWMGPSFRAAFSHQPQNKEWAFFVQSDRVI